MPTKEQIGEYIPFYLKNHDMTVAEFAEKLKVSRITVYNWIQKETVPTYINYITLLSILRECF